MVTRSFITPLLHVEIRDKRQLNFEMLASTLLKITRPLAGQSNRASNLVPDSGTERINASEINSVAF
ncbi:hypothetical protein EMCG_04154 [[Emmonsia] crescens]|uniref:Uncharacterized protein n=1 Tax=[Emmonsia] crescens TaxID=73230 RepID=A0A0G2IZ74_9EURO|nr:hypothetical protein EMCG_04154 [Emmonsia crescens UAMH 3008]